MLFSETEIQERLGEIIHEVVNRIPADQVTPDKDFVADLGVDSLSMIEISLVAQERFSVDIPDADLIGFKTVQDVIMYINSTQVPQQQM